MYSLFAQCIRYYLFGLSVRDREIAVEFSELRDRVLNDLYYINRETRLQYLQSEYYCTTVPGEPRGSTAIVTGMESLANTRRLLEKIVLIQLRAMYKSLQLIRLFDLIHNFVRFRPKSVNKLIGTCLGNQVLELTVTLRYCQVVYLYLPNIF